ncbi:MAG: hypothetical protein A4E63_01599 [Syntrophorhabdus sp. PtaU1.Bin050]|nr:MAG: hypothetical protein A4E63_01599 [Syntrophorhabdus sp. PtaU1.Bin050]
MPRKVFSRARKPAIDDEIVTFFRTGTYTTEGSHGLDIFIGSEWIYELWHSHKASFKNTAAWKIFEEGQGNFPMSTRLSRQGYLRWKEQHGYEHMLKNDTAR